MFGRNEFLVVVGALAILRLIDNCKSKEDKPPQKDENPPQADRQPCATTE